MERDPLDTLPPAPPGEHDNTSIGSLLRQLSREVPELFT